MMKTFKPHEFKKTMSRIKTHIKELKPNEKALLKKKMPQYEMHIKNIDDALEQMAKGNISKKTTTNYIKLSKRAGLRGQALADQQKYDYRIKQAKIASANVQGVTQTANAGTMGGLAITQGSQNADKKKDKGGIAE